MDAEATLDQQRALIDALHRALAAHGEVQRIETHISWVLLVGDLAYKIKKAVNFGFLDYSTLARRERFCREELRLNRRTAPELYLRVVPIGGTLAHPRFDAAPTMEWAVEMRRFPQQALLDHLLAQEALGTETMDAIAASLAAFHGAVAVAAPDSPFGEPDAVFAPMRENFPAIANALGPPAATLGLERHAAWAAERFADLRPLLAARKADGFVRECHGDLHLGNMVQWEGRVIAFDGIEFNPHLRWIDVANELAFTAMDLEARGHAALSRHLINAYLERTGDYACAPLLDLYKHYRALVRAKVTALRYAQTAPSDPARLHLIEELGAYLALAGSYMQSTPPALILTCGITGSGKTHLAGALLDHLPRTLRLRSDVERKRLHGLAPTARTASTVGNGLYTTDATRRTYARLEELAARLLDAGYSALVDATFLRAADRHAFRRLAQDKRVPFTLVAATATAAVLRQRVAARLTAGRDASEADRAVLEHQLAAWEPLAADEEADTLRVDTAQTYDAAKLAEELQRRWRAR